MYFQKTYIILSYISLHFTSSSFYISYICFQSLLFVFLIFVFSVLYCYSFVTFLFSVLLSFFFLLMHLGPRLAPVPETHVYLWPYLNHTQHILGISQHWQICQVAVLKFSLYYLISYSFADLLLGISEASKVGISFVSF